MNWLGCIGKKFFYHIYFSRTVGLEIKNPTVGEILYVLLLVEGSGPV